MQLKSTFLEMMLKKKSCESGKVGETAHWEKELAAHPSSIPGTHKKVGKKESIPQSCPLTSHAHTPLPIDINI